MVLLHGTNFRLLARQTPANTLASAYAFTSSSQKTLRTFASEYTNRNTLHFRSSSLSSAMPKSYSTTLIKMSQNNDLESQISNKYLLSVEQCIDMHKQNSKNMNVVFLDGSFHLGNGRNGRDEFESGPRIQGARYFDINDISSKEGSLLNPKGLPHMRPSKNLFAAAMSALQITNNDHIIFYGTEGCLCVNRAAYTVQNMGHDQSKLHLMQGSLTDWIDSGGEVETNPVKVISASELDDSDSTNHSYKATDATQFCDFEEIMEVVKTGMEKNSSKAKAIILDARGAGRFNGKTPEPREGLRSGHMPGAINIPFTNLVNPANPLKLKEQIDLRQAFQSAGVNIDDTETKLILSCGSGVTACVLATALQECGRDPSSTFVYDGSWTEWGADPNTPIVL